MEGRERSWVTWESREVVLREVGLAHERTGRRGWVEKDVIPGLPTLDSALEADMLSL